ncbi:hypothetical protein CCHL11_06107 [Colletotrichum chlorophyti]|uniref:Ecp2 effector protein-like domain-containing protein n=1 Tax=Colletotrichum chlorophyti TaxID=708187 RepID=A0A1Q8RT59_9PEZI|nr:hypothetical protein CCHL11_06107 [Colletotrichum chlorophyti]
MILSLATVVVATEEHLSQPGPINPAMVNDLTPELRVNHKLQFTRGSNGLRPARLIKRFPFLAGRDEWCGELAEDPATDFSVSAPSAVDCRALVESLEEKNGFWTLESGDFSSNGWARIVSLGTCSFAVRYADLGSMGNSMRIGTNDVRFYSTRYAVLEEKGKLGLQGTVQCYNDDRMLFVTWGMIPA